ncbi:LD-carboxypeptidase [Patescibacteria group bacterium]
MKTIIPERLREGDTVGIVSPSGPVKKRKAQFNKGVKKLESWGLKVKYYESAFDQYYYSAGTAEQRLREFHKIWKDPKVKMVVMSQGGYTANQILDGIDYEMIKKNPKMFVGMSDGTTLVNAIYAKTGLMTYHGPDLMFTFGLPMTKAVDADMKMTFFDGKVGRLKPDPSWKHETKRLKRRGWKTVRPGKASGRLAGGHITVALRTMFSGYFPDLRDKILFLEGTDNVREIDNLFYALKLSGALTEINGMVLGWFDNLNDGITNDFKREIGDVVKEATKGYRFPILEINELGHNVGNYVFPVGAMASIDAKRKYLSIDGRTAK